MEEETRVSKKFTNTKTKPFTRNRTNSQHNNHNNNKYQFQYQYQYQYQQYNYSNQFGFFNNNLYNYYNHNLNNQYQSCYYPALFPPSIPLQLALAPPLIQNQSFTSKIPSFELNNSPLAMSSDTHLPFESISIAGDVIQQQTSLPAKRKEPKRVTNDTKQALVAVRRPDSGGVEGPVISLLANHFLVKFDSGQRIFHYNVEISPSPSKEIARMIKQKAISENPVIFSGALPAYDGRKNLYSPIEFQNDKLELFINLPIPSIKTTSISGRSGDSHKLFRINVKLVSKLDGEELNKYLSKESDEWIPLPQDYLHALDVVLLESPTEKCIPVGRSLYSSSMGGTKEIGGGAIGLR